jgi:16S rRNA (cytosine967-C5)-methyltransferase
MKRAAAGSPRIAAAGLLAEVLERSVSLADAMPPPRGLESRDRAFARHLAYGVLRWLTALQWLAARLLDRPLRKRDRDVQYLVLMGLLQLWQDQAAPHAVVHATSGAARELGKHWAVGVVNAVLRRFQRERATLLAELGERDQRFAHPGWLLEALREDWPEEWPAVVAANNRQAPLWLRINRQRTGMRAYLERLEATGLEASLLDRCVDAERVEPAVPVSRLPGFADGLVSVQDAAAQLAVDLLAPAQGERILDACAAPGGKACHLLERAPAIELTALDRSAERIERVRENLRRLGLDCRLQVADAVATSSWWDGRPFSKILLDAPCSATGVIRRHPEIKWLRDPEQVQSAVGQQRALLDALWPLLDAGGILVYATCSVLKRENSKQIHGFLARHGDAECVGPDAGDRTGQQILPGEAQMDGFYYAVLRKPVQPGPGAGRVQP